MVSSGMRFLLILALAILLQGLLTALPGNALSAAAKTHEGVIYCSEHSLPYMNPQRYQYSPIASTLSKAVYERLIGRDNKTGEIVPGVGKLTRLSKDQLEYTFILDKTVRFHSYDSFVPTRELQAEDVIFSFNRMRDPGNPFYEPFENFPYITKTETLNNIKDIVAVSPYVVRFILKEPDPDFLDFLAIDNSVILSKEYADYILEHNLPPEYIDYNAVGTGPFQESSFVRERYVKLKPFREYRFDKPRIKKLVINRSWKINKRLSQMFTNECHIISNPSASQLTFIEQHRGSNELKIYNRKTVNATFIIFNTKRDVLKNRHTRRTIADAINIRDLNEAVYFGLGHYIIGARAGTNSIFTPDTEPTTEERLASVLELRRTPLRISVFESENGGGNYQIKIAEMLKSDLESIGVKSEIHKYRTDTGLRKLRSGNFDVAIINIFSNLDSAIAPLLACRKAVRRRQTDSEFMNNFTGWCNPYFDSIMNNLKNRRLAENEKMSLYLNARHILLEEMPLVPLLYSSNRYVALGNLKGLRTTSAGGLDFRNVYYEDEELPAPPKAIRSLAGSPGNAPKDLPAPDKSAPAGESRTKNQKADFPEPVPDASGKPAPEASPTADSKNPPASPAAGNNNDSGKPDPAPAPRKNSAAPAAKGGH